MFWRNFFPLVYFFALVDGFISYLQYPATLPFLYKDILIAVVYFFFASQENVGRWIDELHEQIGSLVWFLAFSFMLVCIIQIFNPRSPGLILGLLGFKLYFFYWPLAVLAYAYVDDVERARGFVKTIVYCSIPINLFGLYQFVQGPAYMAATFGPGFKKISQIAFLEGPANVESFLRIYATFASSGQFTNFLVVNSMLCFAFQFSAATRRERLIAIGCQVLNFLALIATGSRGGLVILGLQLIVFGVLCRRARPVLGAALIAGFSLYLAFSWLGKGVARRYEPLRRMEIIRARGLEATQRVFMDVFKKYPLGKGLASASGAARHLAGQESKGWELVENYPSKLQVETGIIGVILFYLSLILFVKRWYERWIPSYRILDDKTFDFSIALTSYCFTQMMVVSLFGGLDTAPASIFLWTLVGLGAKLSTLAPEVETEFTSPESEVPE